MEKNRNGFAPPRERNEQATQTANVYELEQLRSTTLYGLNQGYTDELRTLSDERMAWLGGGEALAGDSGALTDALSAGRARFVQASETHRETATDTLRTYALAAEQFINPKDMKSRHWRRIRNEVRERGSTPGAIQHALNRASSADSRMAMQIVLDHDVQSRIEQKIARHGVEAPGMLEMPTLASTDESRTALQLSLDTHIWAKTVDIARREGPDSVEVQRLIGRASLPESQDAMRKALDDLLWKTLSTVAPALSIASARVQQLLHCASSDGMQRAFFRQLSDHEYVESQRLRSMTYEDLIRIGAAASRFIFTRSSTQDFPTGNSANGNSRYENPSLEASLAAPAFRRPEYEYDIDTAIHSLRAGGLPDNKIERRLARRYHPESGGDEEAMKYLTRRLRE